MLAFSQCRRKDFAIPICAFVADEVEIQRDQFLRVNNTHPLRPGVLKELLPEVSTGIPARLAARQVPARICDWLHRYADSPFFGLVRRGSERRSGKDAGGVAEKAIIRMINESLSSPSGCLFTYRNIATGETDVEGICAILLAYWTAVKQVFPDAWGKPPDQSRLMQAVGIRAMGRLMDRVMGWVNSRDPKAVDYAERELRLISPVCHWTDGIWEEVNYLAWTEVKDAPRHIQALSNFLIRSYFRAKGMA
jgi:DGQHR domain-containing protein